MNRRTFLHGAVVLMAAGLVTRVMGFAYRIFLTRIIGATGMGLFQIVFPLLSLVLTLVTAGLPVAISKLVAEAVVTNDRVRIRRIIRVSTGVVSVMAVVFTALMWILRNPVRNHWLSDPRAYPTYLAMIPIVAVIAISSIYRGYFRGLQDMAPTAWASIIEQTVRIISIWILAAYFIRFSLAYAAAAAMMGMVLGEFTGLIFLIIAQRKRARLTVILPDAPERSLETSRQTLRALLVIALPVTFSSLVGSVIYALEPVLVMRSLAKAGFLASQSTALYGQYSGMAIPLLIFPTVFTGSLAVNLIPSVSEAVAGSAIRKVRVRLAQCISATAMVGIPSSLIMFIFAEPLCHALYNEHGVGPILAMMAPAGVLLYLQGPLAGILQGLNRAGTSMVNSIIGGTVRLGLIWVLASQPNLGILGVALATTISVCLVAILHSISVMRYCGFAIRWMDLWKIGVCSLMMLAYMKAITHEQTNISVPHLLAAIFGGCVLYFVLLCMFRVITTHNVRRVPKLGPFVARLIRYLPFGV